MIRTLAFAGLFAAALALVPNSTRAEDDRFDDGKFVKYAASSGMLEVQLGQLAQKSAKTDAVRTLAALLAEEHARTNQELRDAAKEAGLALPEKLSESDQKILDRFRDYTGGEFDADFVAAIVEMHERSIGAFVKASTRAKNASIRNFATRTLPILQGHLEAARKVQAAK